MTTTTTGKRDSLTMKLTSSLRKCCIDIPSKTRYAPHQDTSLHPYDEWWLLKIISTQGMQGKKGSLQSTYLWLGIYARRAYLRAALWSREKLLSSWNTLVHHEVLGKIYHPFEQPGLDSRVQKVSIETRILCFLHTHSSNATSSFPASTSVGIKTPKQEVVLGGAMENPRGSFLFLLNSTGDK